MRIALTTLVFFSGCAGCTKPIPLTVSVSNATVSFGEQSIPSAATVFVENGVLRLEISGNATAHVENRLDWIRGEIPLGHLTASGGSAQQSRSVKEEEEGAFDIGFLGPAPEQLTPKEQTPVEESDPNIAPPPPPTAMVEGAQVSPYSEVRTYFPSSYVLSVSDFNLFDVDVTAIDINSSARDQIHFLGPVTLVCVIGPEGGGSGIATTTSEPTQINSLAACEKLRPFVHP